MNGPPRAARAVLERLLPDEDRRYALADLDEEFEARASRDGAGKARRWYWSQVLRSTGPLLLHRKWVRKRKGIDRRGRLTGGWGMGMMHQRLEDLGYAVRTLLRAPVTVAVTVISLALGIAAVTTVFMVSEAILAPPAAGLDAPERLVSVYTSEDDGEAYGVSSYPDFESVSAAPALMGTAVAAVRLVSMDDGEGPTRLLGEVVTDNYFSVMGIAPAVGRTFLGREGWPGPGEAVAVLGFDLWQERFAGDPAVVGRVVSLNGQPTTVVGVAPEGVMSRRVPVRPDVWIPLASPADVGRVARVERRDSREYQIVGRLADGATLEEVGTQLATLSRRLAADHPEAWTDASERPRTLTVVPEPESRLNPKARIVLGGVALFFLAAAGTVLLLACTNVTSLFIVRADRRHREIAVRRALGAGRRHIVLMLLAEGLVLGVIAGALGIALSGFLANVLEGQALPMDLPIRVDFDPGARTWIFAFATALAASAAFSVLPALRVSRPPLAMGVRASNAPGWIGSRRLGAGGFLVMAQFALALVLLSGAGLFARSMVQANRLDLGLDPSGIAVTSRVAPEEVGPEGLPGYYQDVLERLGRVSGVEAVALSRGLEMTILQVSAGVSLASTSGGVLDEPMPGYRNSVTAGYLEMLGIPIVRGRSIEARDASGAPRVAVVNETMARRLWPGEDPLGRTVTLSPRAQGARDDPEPITVEVVGVATDGVYLDVGDPATPYLWTSLEQDPSRTLAVTLKGSRVEDLVRVLRTELPPSPGEVPIMPATPYESQLALQTFHLRIASKVLGWAGGFGLFLALIGAYSLMSFTVAQRTREIAIRRAVGAKSEEVVRSVIRQGLVLAGAGLLLGLVVLVPAARLLRSVLIGVGPADPIAIGGGAVLLLLTATVATWIPARRAARVDPIEALRSD